MPRNLTLDVEMDAGQQENAFLECHLQQGGLETCVLVQAPIQDDIWVHGRQGEDGGWSSFWWKYSIIHDITGNSICVFVETIFSHLNLEASVFISLGWSWWRESRGDSKDAFHVLDIIGNDTTYRRRKWTMKSGAGFLYGRGFALKKSVQHMW